MYNEHSFITFTIVQALNIEYYEIYITNFYMYVYTTTCLKIVNQSETCPALIRLCCYSLFEKHSRNQDDD